mgnify:CR=1 FL=1
MAARVCLVHYHEVGLKGKNRAHFEHILMDNIKAALAAFSVNAVSRISGYILVTFNEHQADEAARVIRTVPGVARVSLAYHTNRDPQEYCAAAVKALREELGLLKVQEKRIRDNISPEDAEEAYDLSMELVILTSCFETDAPNSRIVQTTLSNKKLFPKKRGLFDRFRKRVR